MCGPVYSHSVLSDANQSDVNHSVVNHSDVNHSDVNHSDVNHLPHHLMNEQVCRSTIQLWIIIILIRYW